VDDVDFNPQSNEFGRLKYRRSALLPPRQEAELSLR